MSSHPFDEAIALESQADGTCTGQTHPAYANMVGPYGGITTAQALQAVLQHPKRLGDPVSLTVNFCAAVADGAFVVQAWPARTDPECMLYAGFASPADKRACERVRATPPDKLAATHFDFKDARFDELLFRYRARNWPDTLDTDAHERWRNFVRDKLTRATETTTLALPQYFATIDALRGTQPPGAKQALLDQLQAWGDTVATEFGL